jgi:hypothetical protein
MAQPPSERDITLVNIEFEGTEIWVPGSVAVKKGDIVKIKAIDNAKSDPPVHGFANEALERDRALAHARRHHWRTTD